MPQLEAHYMLERKPTALERQYGYDQPVKAYAPLVLGMGYRPLARVKWQGTWWRVTGIRTRPTQEGEL